MPRIARTKSETGIYHVMLRGINRQTIFEDEEDYIKFIKTLERYKKICEYEVFAYCLMTNHIHILLKVEKEDIDLIMKRVAGSYVYWYNWKYDRVGHLFQDRFKSEPVEDDAYLLTVIRYIHQNPLKAKIVEKIEDYKYSSYNDYMENKGVLIDTELALSMIGINEFVRFNNEENEDICLDIVNAPARFSDRDASKIIMDITGCHNSTEFQNLPPILRDEHIATLKANGLSIRQISRLTGISFGLVRK